LNGIASPPGLGTEPAAREGFDQKVAGDAVQGYFHLYEIVATTPWTLQAIFMHMKEAI
jgi:hypothetical protein